MDYRVKSNLGQNRSVAVRDNGIERTTMFQEVQRSENNMNGIRRTNNVSRSTTSEVTMFRS